VKQLTEAMGGKVTVESTPGAGATFVVTLNPAVAASAHAPVA
jgi:signal transduction histidine kinase